MHTDQPYYKNHQRNTVETLSTDTLVNGQLQSRTPFSHPEGVRLRELPL